MKRNRDLRNRDLNGTNIKVIQRDGYESYYYKMPDGFKPQRREPIDTLVEQLKATLSTN